MNCITGKEIICVIEEFWKLEWYRYGTLDVDDQNKYCPINIWRYDSTYMTPEEIKYAETRIKTVIKSFDGEINWMLYFSGRNWVLLPREIKVLEDSGKYKNDTEVLKFMAKDNPELGIRANRELNSMAKYIKMELDVSEQAK